ncbi:hypothetical protein OQA88_2101 [Cercophora sp. LCS_1]
MREKRRVEDDSQAIKTGAVINPAVDGMKLDTSDASNLAAYPDRKQDVKMHGQESKSADPALDVVEMKTSNDASSPDVTYALEATLDSILSHVTESTQPTWDKDGSNTEQQDEPL